MKRPVILAFTLIMVGSMLVAGSAAAEAGSVSRGGRLYDKWWKETGADAPTTDHLLWPTQSTNARSGDDTWRCKECHGWDYLGKDGAYGSGSHFTGFPGVYDAAHSKSVEELAAALKGATNPDHDFSSVLDDAAINDLATFLKEGLVDARQYIDYETKAPTSADVSRGTQLFESVCAACHGADGTVLNFGDEEEPEYLGTLANDNPQETLHKERFGHPASAMPATVDLGWSVQDAVDVLAYAQTLPTGEAPVILPETGAEALSWRYQVPLLTGLVLIAAGLVLLGWQRVRRSAR